MTARLDSWWQRIKQRREFTGIIVCMLVVVVALTILGYRFDWTGFKGKTMWDWLQLLGVLAVPVVVGFGVAWFTHVQQLNDQRRAREQLDRDQALEEQRARTEREAAEKRAQLDREIALDSQREAALQAYIDTMSALLLDRNLRASQPAEEVRIIARVRTLLSSVRQPPDLTKGPPKSVGTTFGGANLTGAKLIGAHLSNVYFVEAMLVGADLSGAVLSGADLSDANLHEARITAEQLATVRSLQGATMPDGSKHLS